ncbi:hydrophobic/amphiphilic exporter-1, HAE1 family/multidrug efflux pump [Nitrosomonas sp. Nm51]|uniref:efflux RND transporter permease subunit n=1 Tax=Nitrosomonas sp. Nm51 TaxID=133720 RepID=UPI0008CBBE0D|nr:multidrug efflux RND transporter permease subunit [Nitrosomonas sp. Nm51]SER17370.1 hydrophobic/amphiphilic exporter-1, HAE1 family/multidrug efflux pump [Nitrosomonas sp. Nm51]
MNLRFFIDRPIFASVLSILIVVVGLVSFLNLPVAQFPDIVPPMIQIEADYPGANAETVAESVARPIEIQLPGIDNLLYYDSTSTNDGHMTMRLTFEIGTDIDIAQVQTQNRQKLAEPQLPEEVLRRGVTVKKMSPNMLAVIALSSTDPRHDPVYISNYALIQVLDNIKRLPGVGDAIVYGAQDYAMRLILDPVRMAQLNITPTEIANVVREQNRDFPAGRIGRDPTTKKTELTIPVITSGRMSDVKEFENMIVRAYPDGSMVRMRDVAKVELGAQSYDLEGRWNSKPNTFLLTFLSPGANALNTVRSVRAEMDKLSDSFPAGMSFDVPYDTTQFIEVSIEEVFHTLIEAAILVILVVFLFLQSWRTTLIPAITIPISLIGTMAGMYALGFSINTLTLFGMVLAIGIVVDDAIIVVENVERNMTENGLSPKDAAIKALGEVTGAIIASVLVLAAVFVPVAFLEGITGQMYKQFAITIAVSVAISGFTALTLSPALCALVLKSKHGEPKGFWKLFNSAFGWTQLRYVNTVDWILKRKFIALGIFVALIISMIGMFKIIPKSFLPDEDQGYFITIFQLPEGASKSRTTEVVSKIEAYFQAQPAVHSTDALVGQNFVFNTRGTNQATMFVPLQLWNERKEPGQQAQSLIADAFEEFATIPDALILAFNAPAISGLGATGGFSLQLQDPTGRDFAEFADKAQSFAARATEHPAIAAANTNFRINTPRLFAHIDRERAKSLGVPISDVFDTMQAYFGNLYINDFVKFGRVYRVQTEAPPEYRSSPEDISKIFVRVQNDSEQTMIPLDTIVSTDFNSGPNPVTHFNGFNSALVLGAPAPGYSSGQAMEALEQLAEEMLKPEGYTMEWDGISFQESKAGGQTFMILAFALLMVFLVLAAQYESWSTPFAVILIVPFGILGALFAIWMRDLSNDIYFQIGLITLIGLAAKNAILIVEFASQRYTEGLSLTQAALEAARLRFRPIIMTSMAFILGVLPLVTASGAGAASRHSIGTGVFGGMLAATFLAIFFVPLFFAITAGLSRKARSSSD